MSQYVETPTKAFSCSGAIAQYLRVKTPSSLAIAGATDVELGTIEAAAFAAGEIRSVRLRTAQGTCKMVAAGAFSAAATVYGAAGGKIDDVDNGNRIGIALEAATAANDIVEVMRLPGPFGSGTKSVEAHTADDTLTAAESGTVHTTVGASGTVTFTLPAATVGLEYFFRVGAAQELRIDPDGTETIALPSTGVQGAAGKYLTANADGETVHILCDNAGEWSCYGYTGTWTAES
jgi:hypothetical protein